MPQAHIDLRNRPTLGEIPDDDLAIVSPRAEPRWKNTIAHVGPFAPWWNDKPVLNFDWGAMIWAIVDSYGLFNDDRGRTVWVTGPDIELPILDFSNRHFVDYLVMGTREVLEMHLPEPKWRGVLFDYGTPDLSWEHSLADRPISAYRWKMWEYGWATFRAMIDLPLKFSQHNQWTGLERFTSTGLVFEKIGWRLNPKDHVGKVVQDSRPARHIFISEGGQELDWIKRVAQISDGWWAVRGFEPAFPDVGGDDE